MAARKKKAPARKTKKRKAPAKKRASPKKRASRRVLPNDEAWRELIATAIEKPDPDAQPARPGAARAKKAPKGRK